MHRPTTKAKPNTRFLRNIIKETTNHNQALLAKEAAEAQARLDKLAEAKAKQEKKHRPSAQDIRRRQLGAITATLQGKKRKLAVGDAEGSSSRKRESAELDAHREHAARQDHTTTDRSERAVKDERSQGKESERDHRPDRERDRESERRHKRDRSPSSDPDKVSRKRGRKEEDRSRSPGYRDRKERHSHRHRHRHRDRSSSADEGRTDKRSPSRSRHRSSRHIGLEQDDDSRPRTKHRSSRHRDRSRDDDTRTAPREKQQRRHRRDEDTEPTKEQYDSDPLEALIGPLPTSSSTTVVRPRGRGAASGPSAMDGRFSEAYDPRSDVRPDSDADGDDWADSLEALKDRERWRRQGAERLRAAGFTEDQVKGWEKGSGREKDVADVKWAKEGEGREWDRGKVDLV